MENTKKKLSPWFWVPSLYFAQGIPYVVVATTVALIMYKRLGISNTDIALYTSWLYLPWVIKPFWSPFVDLIKTKRWWIVTMQLLIGAGLAGVALTIPMPFFFQATLAVFWLIAFSSATHDIAADGFYMLALDSSQQSFFVGIRSTFYRLAMISGQGLLIIIAGSLESFTGLEPLNLTVAAGANGNPTMMLQDPVVKQQKKEICFLTAQEEVSIQIGNISPDSLKKIKEFAHNQNLQYGFVNEDKVVDKSGEKKASLWTTHVSEPLGAFIKHNFGEKKTVQSGSDGQVGNAVIIPVRISKKPEPGDNVVLNTSFKDGDKSISIIAGERLVFNESNWDKPAYLVFQLDYKLKNEVNAEFKAVSGNLKLAWSITFFIVAGIFILFFVYHRFILPQPDADMPSASSSFAEVISEFGNTFKTFFQKPGVALAITFMLLYRLGEAMLVKMASPFLLDAAEVGGLGLTTGQVGIVYGTVGIIALTLGGIVGGIAASRQGLKYWIWPMALSITFPHLTYVYMSYFLPENLLLINIAVAVEQFGYGFGFTAYMLYMIYFADGKHKTAHYAMLTGFMALGMMLPGMIAGWLQELIGYYHFFIFIMLCTIPTLAVIPFMKIDRNFGKKKQ